MPRFPWALSPFLAAALLAALPCHGADQRHPMPAPLEGPIDEMARPSVKDILDEQARQGQSRSTSVMTPEIMAKLNLLYQTGSYADIDGFVARYPYDATLSAWVTDKATKGNVPMMWTLADRYASLQTIDKAINWAFAGMFGVLQERSICLDKDVDYASSIIAQKHPRLIQYQRANPHLIKDAKLFAMKVLREASDYPDPTAWLCKPYASPGRLQSLKTNRPAPLAYDPLYHPILRARARNALRLKFEILEPAETPPPMPTAQAPTAPLPGSPAPAALPPPKQ